MSNPIQFAVVREDPEVEARVLRSTRARRVLLIASGGCTALTLQPRSPDCRFTLVDTNPAQLDLIRRKITALQAGGSLSKLNSSGNLEALFRGLSTFLTEHCAVNGQLEPLVTRQPETLIASPYWPVGFQLFFHDALLRTMFGPRAIDHVQAGSYPDYFRSRFEQGLRARNRRANYFLHHALLGRYLDVVPDYLTEPAAATYHFEFIRADIKNVAIDGYDLISLSNIFDWMAEDDIKTICQRVGAALAPGGAVIYRQLNSRRQLEHLFGQRVHFDADEGAQLLAHDRSLFYESIHVGRASG